jgi:hypothetical protein
MTETHSESGADEFSWRLEVLGAWEKFPSRLILVCMLLMMAVLQVLIASKVLTDGEAAQLENLVWGFGAWEIISYGLILWAFAPFLKAFQRIILHWSGIRPWLSERLNDAYDG